MELQKDQVSTVRKEVLDVGSEVELRNILLSGHQDSIVRGKLWIQELLILAQKPPLPLQNPAASLLYAMAAVMLFSLNLLGMKVDLFRKVCLNLQFPRQITYIISPFQGGSWVHPTSQVCSSLMLPG